MYTQFFGNYLLANGYVTRDQLFSAMRQEADQHMKLGTLAIHAGYMNAAQVDDVVIHQTHQDNRFGELAIQLGYLTEAQVEELLKQQTPAFLSLGQVLLDEGVLTNTDFEQIIQDYRSKNGMEDEESLIERRKNIQQLFENFFSSTDAALSEKGHMFIHEQFHSYDEYVQASLEDFLNLQNGLFIVNVSNTSNTELTLGAPEHITVSPIQFSGRTLHIPVLYTFGTIDFYMERVSIKE